MKATIHRPDGTRIELEGTTEELAPFLQPPAPIQLQPFQPLTLPWTQPWMVGTCQHEFPENWGGLTAPACKKCGAAQWTITYSGFLGGDTSLTTCDNGRPLHTSGFLQVVRPNLQGEENRCQA